MKDFFRLAVVLRFTHETLQKVWLEYFIRHHFFLFSSCFSFNTVVFFQVSAHENLIRNAPIVVIDANLPPSTIASIYQMCFKHKKPVFFEPTDMTIAERGFQLPKHQVVKFISPNLFELRQIARHFHCTVAATYTDISRVSLNEILIEVAELSRCVVEHVPNIITTLGQHGIAIMRHEGASTDSFFTSARYVERSPDCKPVLRYYPAPKVDNVVNVSGAGDSFMSGFTAAMLRGHPENVCVNVGFEAARCALHSKSAVAHNYFHAEHSCWQQAAAYRAL
jgi:pseudouridine-5'-phosphate glycosidase/pseudouridine kinase